MKKVLVFSLAYFPKHVGGAEVSVKEITDRLPDFEFHMIANRFDSTLPKVEQVGRVLVHRIGITKADPSMADLRAWPLHLNKLLYQFLAAWKAIQLHRLYHYDATWAVMAHSCGIPAMLFKFFHPEVKFILNLQEGDPPRDIERTMRPLWPLFKRVFTSADIVQALSTFLAKWARERGFTGPIEVIPNAVDSKHFSQSYPKAVLQGIRDKLGKKPGDVFMITTSRLVRKNAVDDVIRALPLLPEHVHFIILGIGPDADMLKNLAKRLGVFQRTLFWGQVGHEEMPKYLQACDIFIRPSRSEGMGASFPEAMAAGLPIIATQEGGIADFLFDAKKNPEKATTGWAVSKDSPGEIADAVKDILANPDTVKEVTATAKVLAFSDYDWDTIAAAMKERVFSVILPK